jgi:ABC-2 type transport system permease protein
MSLTATSRTAAPFAPPLPRRPGWAPVSETLTLIGRCVRLSRRDVETLVMAIALPLMLMVLFVYVFGGAIDTGTAYINYVVAGIVLLCVGFGAASTAPARPPSPTT